MAIIFALSRCSPLAAINFGFHYVALFQGRLRQYLFDIETRSFLVFVFGLVLLVG